MATASLDVSQKVLAHAGWDAKFDFLQPYFPPWVQRVVTENPGQFNAAEETWALLRRREPRGAKTPGGLNALADLDVPLYPEEVASMVASLHAGDPDDIPGVLAAMSDMGCWRCGSLDHHRHNYPKKASAAEASGSPLGTWKARPGRAAPAQSTTQTVAALAQRVVALETLVRQQAASSQRQGALLVALVNACAGPWTNAGLGPSKHLYPLYGGQDTFQSGSTRQLHY